MAIDRDDNLMSSPEKLRSYLSQEADRVQQTMSTEYIALIDALQTSRLRDKKFVKQAVRLWENTQNKWTV